MIKKQFIETKDIDRQNHTVTVMVSAERVDRDKEVILLDAWKNRLDVFKAHPIILANHESWDIRNQIGKATDVYIVEGLGLFAKMEYFVNAGNELADWAWYLVEKGLGSWSVGFMPHGRQEGSGDVRQIYTDVELYEISQVLVPSLREAIQRDASLATNETMLAIAKSVYKSGRVISGANLEKLKAGKEALTNVINVIDDLISLGDTNQESNKSFPKQGSITSPIGEDEQINILTELKSQLEKEA